MFSWFSDNWKSIVSVAAAIVVGVAVTALIIATAPVSLPALLVTTAAIAVGGFAGGVTGYLVNKWLNDEPIVIRDMLIEGTISMVVSVATLGLGRFLAPLVSRVVAPVASRALPEVAAPFVTRTVSSTVSFATAGATTGAGAQVANNALHDRPLLENVDTAAKRGAIFSSVFVVAAEVTPLVLGKPPLVETPATPVKTTPRVSSPVAAKTAPVDPVTQTTMDSYGITRDTIVYRVTEPQYVQGKTMTGNPRSSALVRDPYNLIDNPMNELIPELNLPPVPRRVNASTLGPSLNVAVKDPSIYSRPGMVKVGIRIGDVLDRGGKIYPDAGAVAEGLKPLIVTFDGPIPVVVIEPIGVTQTSASSVTSTRGIVGPLSDVSK